MCVLYNVCVCAVVPGVCVCVFVFAVVPGVCVCVLCNVCVCVQSFQACVCVSSQRVGVLLDRGETMMQRCAPGDAQEVESSLLRLLQRLTSTFSRITSTHRRLLSMRLVPVCLTDLSVPLTCLSL